MVNYSTEPSWLITLALFALPLNFIIGAFVANAAQRKGRSWAAFFWLSVLAGWLIMAIVVAAIAPIEGKQVEAVAKRNVTEIIGGAIMAFVGLLWIVVYYASAAQAPIAELRNWNILLGFLLLVGGVVTTTFGFSKKSSK